MWLEDENMSHWLVGSIWERHRTVSSKKEENVSSSTLNSKDIQYLLCKQSWSTFWSQSSCNSKIGDSLGPIFFFIAIEDYCFREKKCPQKKRLITFKIYQEKWQNNNFIWQINDGQYSLWEYWNFILWKYMSLEMMYLYFWKSMALHPENRKDVTVIQRQKSHPKICY